MLLTESQEEQIVREGINIAVLPVKYLHWKEKLGENIAEVKELLFLAK